ncbi:MAG: DegV family protein, partial [Gemmatimonadota bacterium]
DERYRYCTEALVRGDGLPEAERVRSELRDAGGSLIVVRGADALKVHVHTDEPESVFERLRAYGRLTARKAEDMKAQHDAIARAAASHVELARRPVAVVADTGCDLPDEVVRAHGIRLVPLLLVYDDATLRDRLDIDAAGFVERLRRGEHPGTSQPSPADFLDVYARAADDAETLVGVTLAAALSGTFASAETAARRFEGADVRLVDSRGASLLQGLLALRAAELAEAGLDADAIVRRIARIRDRSGILFTVDRLDRLLASGRITRRQARLGALLGIKPILALDREGRVRPAGRAWGRRRLVPKVMDILAAEIPDGAARVRLGVVHVDCEPVAERVRAALEDRFRPDELIVAPATPVIATHIGRGAWGVAYTVEATPTTTT